jgi:hypothetical protein
LLAPFLAPRGTQTIIVDDTWEAKETGQLAIIDKRFKLERSSGAPEHLCGARRGREGWPSPGAKKPSRLEAQVSLINVTSRADHQAYPWTKAQAGDVGAGRGLLRSFQPLHASRKSPEATRPGRHASERAYRAKTIDRRDF